MLVLDYSAGKPGAAAIKAAGYGGAVRYIGFPTRTKCTSRAELADFTNHGLGMALVYEDTATDWRGGFARGRDAGRRARDHADTIGFPTGRPIYLAVDQDVVTAVEFAVMVEYLRGAAQTLGGVGLTGVYGEHDVCVRAQQAGVASWFWQCRAWSGTPVKLFAGRHLYQRVGTVQVGGIACDINDVLAPDWGQHNAPKQEEDDMFSDADRRLLRNVDEAIRLGKTGVQTPGVLTGYIARTLIATERFAGELDELEASILAAIKADATDAVDVEQLAGLLRDRLGADVADELAHRLAAGATS